MSIPTIFRECREAVIVENLSVDDAVTAAIAKHREN